MNLQTFIVLAIIIIILIIIINRLRKQKSPCAGCSKESCPSHINNRNR